MRARPLHPGVGLYAVFVAAVALGVVLPAAWAAPSMIDLPPGESAADWGAALARQGLGEGPGGVEVTVAPDGWHLGLTTSAGRREALVPTPTTRAGRDAVAALAAALLTPSPLAPELPTVADEPGSVVDTPRVRTDTYAGVATRPAVATHGTSGGAGASGASGVRKDTGAVGVVRAAVTTLAAPVAPMTGGASAASTTPFAVPTRSTEP